MKSRKRAKSAGLLAALLAAACASDPDTRPQLVVELDTDAPVVGQLRGGGPLSPAIAIDTVRVDIVSADRDVFDHRDVAAPDPRDWPLSFGIAAQSGTPRRARLRIRAFWGALASRGVLSETTTIEPPENVLIDRIVDVDQPERGTRTVRVVLATACFGAPASFQSPARTCVDGARREADPSEGVLEGSATSLAGTALEASEQPCTNPPREGAHCVPGGPTVLGDPRVNGLDDGPPTIPRRPALLSPFHMDETEFTVGRYRKLLKQGAVSELPREQDLSSVGFFEFCTWLGPDDAQNDDSPLNCISHEAASRACEADGGHLPTEAQWEHAARGRGRDYLYPWGNEAPECCTASASRTAVAGGEVECPGKGIEHVGSHTEESCTAVDRSMDGIEDLAGSLREMIADGGMSFGDRCWMGPGLKLDPSCVAPDTSMRVVARGGDWTSGRGFLATALRTFVAMSSNNVGFRCIYDDRP